MKRTVASSTKHMTPFRSQNSLNHRSVPSSIYPRSLSTCSSNPSSRSLLSRLLGPFVLVVVAFVFFHNNSTMFKFNKHKNKPSSLAHVSSISSVDASATNAFAIRLFTTIAGTSSDVLISPASIASALGLTALGVTKDSNAEKQFSSLLPKQPVPITTISSSDITVNVATSAWFGSDVLPSFRETSKTYGADIYTAPFTVKDVNSWVSDKTQKKIPSILDQLPEQLVAIIINAVYFRGDWTSKFDKADTSPQPFEGVSKPIPFMHKRNFPVPFANIPFDETTIKMADIPYGENELFSGTIVVPQGDLKLEKVIERLGEQPQIWHEWTSALAKTKLVFLAFPRFKLEYGVTSLKDPLRKLGLTDAFDLKADAPPFKGISDDPRVVIDDVMHKATIECTEEGTVASAASAVVLQTRSLVIGGPELVVDRPFLFAIRERKSGLILFMARIDKPVNP